MGRIILALVALIASCKPGDKTRESTENQADPIGVSAPRASKLDQIFKPDMIGAQVAYLETIIGPAKHLQGTVRKYSVDSCDIDVGTDGQRAVTWLGMNLSTHCGFNLAPFLHMEGDANHAELLPLPPVNKMTIGMFEQIAGIGVFKADCLRLCGNAYKPSVYLYRSGSHADNFNDVLLGTTDADASYLWASSMIAAHGKDYVTFGKFNCDRDRDEVTHSAFKDIQPNYARVGKGVADDLLDDCTARLDTFKDSSVLSKGR